METKEEADQAQTAGSYPAVNYKISLTYTLKDGAWKFKDGSYESPSLRGSRFPITPEGIDKEPNAIPNVVIQYWLGSKSSR